MIPENRFPRQQDAAGELEGFSVKQKIEKLKKFHSIRFSLTSVVALLILLSVFISPPSPIPAIPGIFRSSPLNRSAKPWSSFPSI